MLELSDQIRTLARDLQDIFGARLRSVVTYGGDGHEGRHTHAGDAALTHTMALVETITLADLRACAARAGRWEKAGLATPLVLAEREFERSLDAFPLEFGAILASHVVVFGQPPFGTLAVNPADVRRACETQARSHLLHLREGFVEAHGNGDALAVLIVRSASPLAALLRTVARLRDAGSLDSAAAARYVERTLALDIGILDEVVRLADVKEISSADATRIFPPYLDAVERLVANLDRGSGTR